VPVFHGDAVFDVDTDVAILSGDVVVRELCAFFKPKRAVFVTDVPGIFDKPPPKPKRARLGVANEEGLPVHTKKKRLSVDDETKKLTLIREVRVTKKQKRKPPRTTRRMFLGARRASPRVSL
jgi:isopentenyl phosphate kinase